MAPPAASGGVRCGNTTLDAEGAVDIFLAKRRHKKRLYLFARARFPSSGHLIAAMPSCLTTTGVCDDTCPAPAWRLRDLCSPARVT